jgi:antirestriction protein
LPDWLRSELPKPEESRTKKTDKPVPLEVGQRRNARARDIRKRKEVSMEKEPDEQLGGGNEHKEVHAAEVQPNSLGSGPRIYVASLSDYNAGHLHGAWIPAATDREELDAHVQAMLATSPTPGAEEFGIFDYDGFGPLRLDEYESLTSVSTVARGIELHGPAFAHWAELVGINDLGQLARFEDAYLGHWENVKAYVDDFLDGIGANHILEEGIPEYLQPYVTFDVEAFGRDLEMGGDIATSAGDGGVYVFDGRG